MTRERHGVAHDTKNVTLTERVSGVVRLIVTETATKTGSIDLLPDEAEYLATKLRRMARRQRVVQDGFGAK